MKGSNARRGRRVKVIEIMGGRMLSPFDWRYVKELPAHTKSVGPTKS